MPSRARARSSSRPLALCAASDGAWHFRPVAAFGPWCRHLRRCSPRPPVRLASSGWPGTYASSARETRLSRVTWRLGWAVVSRNCGDAMRRRASTSVFTRSSVPGGTSPARIFSASARWSVSSSAAARRARGRRSRARSSRRACGSAAGDPSASAGSRRRGTRGSPRTAPARSAARHAATCSSRLQISYSTSAPSRPSVASSTLRSNPSRCRCACVRQPTAHATLPASSQ